MTVEHGLRPSGTLLLVEDDPDHAFLVRRGLAQHHAIGLPVLHLTTAASAAERLSRGDVRCVVLDLSLPDAQGMQAVHQLRSVAPDVPIVVLTGLDSESVGLQALQVGAQDYLVKGQHPVEAVARSVVFAMERARRERAEQDQARLGQELAVRDAQLSEAQRLARIGSWEWEVLTGQVAWSVELQRLTGIGEVRGTEAFQDYLDRVAEEDRGDAARLFSREAAEDPPVIVRHRLVQQDGTFRWIQGQMTAACWDETGLPTRILGTMQDITEQKTAEDLLAHQALHDSLTGLVNREVLLDRLGRVLSEPRLDDSSVAVIFLDLDQFKWVNDSRSHATGDRLLVEVARRFESAVRATDTLARFGGDEFVVLRERVTRTAEVLELVERLTSSLEEPIALDDDPASSDSVAVTASMGVATGRPGAGLDPGLLVRDADIAMYRAKERGRARFEIFDEDMRDRAAARLRIQKDLQQALQDAEVEVHFQPVVDPRTGLVTGTEALARWQHPRRGLLGPEEFIPHAEETGLIVPLGTAILEQACRVTAEWNRRRLQPLTVAVNLSARQLSQPDLMQVVRHALDVSGLSPRLLCLELTETAIMEDPDASSRRLSLLRALGVSVAIDDFGTGYSSLAYLLSLPVDLLKVDRSFVAAVDEEGPGKAIVTAVLALSHTLRLGVVAEGVERPSQRDALVALGVTAAQGWLWGRAVPASLATWAQDRPGQRPPGLVGLPPARQPAESVRRHEVDMGAAGGLR